MSGVRPGSTRISSPFEARTAQGAARVEVKICGVTQAEHAICAAEAGARWLGFVFEPRSPRAVTAQAAADLARDLANGSDRIVSHVGLWVDPSDERLDEALARAPIDMIQLHGAETPERVAEIRTRFGLPVMKAISIAEPADVASIDAYIAVADVILVDAKPPKGANLTGGGGVSFDWSLIAGRSWRKPWMLAGGLTPENVAAAIEATAAPAVDVSSGVEATRGVKDSEKIKAFIAAAHAASASMNGRNEVS